jgi:hypothetical protein
MKKYKISEISHEHVLTPDGVLPVRVVKTRYIEIG